MKRIAIHSVTTPAWSFVSVLFSLFLGASMLWAARAPAAGAVDLKGGETPEQVQAAYTKAIQDLAPELGVKDSRALSTFEATLHNAARPGAETERLACCKAIAAALEGNVPPEAKAWMLKLVQHAARDELVAVCAKLLVDKELLIRESARCALQHNPAPEAGEVLRQALAKANDPAWQGALALALGARKEAPSVPLIARLLGQPHPLSVDGALIALGNIANAEAAKALAAARKAVPEKWRATAAESWMKCAEQMLKEGQSKGAAEIYGELYKPQEPRPVRLAALRGLLQSAGDQAGQMVLDLLTGGDADAKAIATGHISDLSSGAVRVLVGGIGKLPPPSQVMILGVMAARGEKSALPLAMAFARDNDETLKLAGLNALGRLGDATAVPLLLETMKAAGNAAAEARDSLTRLPGPGINELVVAAMQRENDPKQRGTLIEVLDARGATVAVPALLQEVASAEANLRRQALRALGKLASAKEVPPLVTAMLKAAPGGERDEAEKAIAAACGRITPPDQQAGPVLALYNQASPADRVVLLPLLGRIGGARALEAIKPALASTDAAVYQAGVAALYNWPDATETVADELLAVAKRAEKPNDRAAALRAYVRVVTMPSGLPEKARLAQLQKAMDLAERDQEKNLVLERCVDIKHTDTVKFLLPYLDQPALAQKAGTAIVDLARDQGLRSRGKTEFEQALNKIVATSKDQNLVDRAKRRLAEK